MGWKARKIREDLGKNGEVMIFLGILEFAGDVGVKDRVFVSVNGWSMLVLLPHSSMKIPSCRHVAFEKSNR